MPSSHLFLSNEETRELFPRDRREHREVGGIVWGVVERRDSALRLLLASCTQTGPDFALEERKK